jgi:hypothetical protein
MRLRVCAEPGCPELGTTTRCQDHTRKRDRARGTRHERGYDAKHERLRKSWVPRVALGVVECWRCGERISPLEPWQYGHCDDNRDVWHGPEHRACNLATASHGRCTHVSHI